MKCPGFLILILLFSKMAVFSQDTVFYNVNMQIVTTRTDAVYYELKDSVPANPLLLRMYYMNGGIRSENNYADIDRRIYNGEQKVWYPSGVLKRCVQYTRGSIEGSLKTYWDNGRLKREDVYRKGALLSGQCYTRRGKKTDYESYYILPSFPGGHKALLAYIRDHFNYPEVSLNKGFSGKVVVSFVIAENGSISNVAVSQSLDPDIDQRAVRFIQEMPDWIPAKEDGQPVRCTYFFPISLM